MNIITKNFGEIEVNDAKIITFPSGIIGFPDIKEFMLIHDDDKDDGGGVRWLQSLGEPGFALPVIDPLLVRPDYDPTIDDDLLKPIGEVNVENMLVLTTITIPHEIENMSINLMAPIVINTDTKKAVQIIIEDDNYEVKFRIYDILKEAKEKAEKEKAGEGYAGSVTKKKRISGN